MCTLSLRSTENHIHLLVADGRYLTNKLAADVLNRLRQNSAFGKIVFVNGRVNRIDFNRGQHVEARLLEAQAHTACARK